MTSTAVREFSIYLSRKGPRLFERLPEDPKQKRCKEDWFLENP
jgi:hypothetical protein